MKFRNHVFKISILVIAFAFPLVKAVEPRESWPQFRGHSGTAIAEGRGVPVNLSRETLRWSVNLPGQGTSSPVVWGDRLFVTAEIRSEGKTVLNCLDASSGKTIWSRAIEGGNYPTHNFNNLASGTPSLTADLVILGWLDVPTKHAKLSAYTHGGDIAWQQDLGPHVSQHGVSFNPVIYKDYIVINHAHMDGGFTGVYRVEDGSPVWSQTHPKGPKGIKTSYVSPLIREREDTGSVEVVQAGEKIGIVGFDLETGKVNWSLPDAFNHRTIASPIVINGAAGSADALIAAGNKNGHFFAARVPKVEGGKVVREPKIEWHMESRTPYVPTPVSDGRILYALEDGGTLTALDAESGQVIYRERLLGNFFASPLLVDGKLYCLDRDGNMWVVQSGETYKLLRKSELSPPDDVAWTDATPAVANDRLFVRLGSRLDSY